MEKLIRKQLQLGAALKTLDVALHEFSELNKIDRYYEPMRDSVIKRFEYSIDLFWKFLKIYLEDHMGMLPPAAPKGIFKAALDAQIISDAEEAELRLLIENRNLTSHTYNIELAEVIAHFVPQHYKIMNIILERLQN